MVLRKQRLQRLAPPRPERQDKRHASLSSRRMAQRIMTGSAASARRPQRTLRACEPAGKGRRDQIEGVVAVVEPQARPACMPGGHLAILPHIVDEPHRDGPWPGKRSTFPPHPRPRRIPLGSESDPGAGRLRRGMHGEVPGLRRGPKDKCLADVAECDYYVLILAWRYGYQPEDDNPRRLSITHLEYEEALRLKKPCLPFLLDPDAPWKRGFQDPDSHSPDSAICRFRDHVEKRHGRSFYTTPDSLARAIHEAIRAQEQKDLTDGAKAKAQIRESYLAWLRGSCESVELLGLDLKESQNVRLGQVYVPAVATGHTLLLRRLGKGSLYVPGAPGSGKSTFCRWLALLAAGGTLPDHPIPAPEGFRETLPDALRSRFPMLCRLREWAGREEGLSGKGHWTRTQLEESLSDWLDHTCPGGLTGTVFREDSPRGIAC